MKLVPGFAAAAEEETKLLLQLAALRSTDNAEQQLLGTKINDSFDRLKARQKQLLLTLQQTLRDLAAAAAEAAAQQERAKVFGDAAANALEGINAIKPVLAQARQEALQA
ncbi:uncharacterized protein EMH_0098250 [Eimeria mitis]|uniref:Uncharacterized protein n=1 Tax=Eimeria mitis TaxID=44415 RepID=U6KH15_9EIME|nr:uncharacterized protein EMH_0098250 [Eimeria mitis]CDJ35547.1 hypothetical protein EMH_0098250 [Eimeria mitis]